MMSHKIHIRVMKPSSKSDALACCQVFHLHVYVYGLNIHKEY